MIMSSEGFMYSKWESEKGTLQVRSFVMSCLDHDLEPRNKMMNKGIKLPTSWMVVV